ncbi:transketolase [Campylobacterota bacterium]|nr:transketolase [Campylobacterota bacterium]
MQLDRQLLTELSNTIRFLAVDMIEKAASGHPGTPMGLADTMAVFSFHHTHNPKNPAWLGRDRLVFSGGHASALAYSMLYLWGYDLTLDDLKAFRQLDSKTPGHPEVGQTAGIEVTTGPLGQGVANAVGFALATKEAARRLGAEIIDHSVWCFCGDGDLMEGISYEACSIAGHQALDNLIVYYDKNDITIDGDLSITFNEDVAARFEAQQWAVRTIDGHDFGAIDEAFNWAKEQKKPALIIAKTRIARGSANLEGSNKTHGAPLGATETLASKTKAGVSLEPFSVSDKALLWFRTAIEKGELAEREWNERVSRSEKKDLLERLLNPDFEAIEYPIFDDKPRATRETNHAILNAIAASLPGFLGGSADLAGSNKTDLKESARNIRYGIREHAMAAIGNALSLYGLFIPFSATFFVFSDYMRPSVRVAALMGARHYFIWTHDSIGVGEDGATHQPIEQLSSFRAMPNLYLFRPADGVENVECWKSAFELDAPCAFVLSRQNLPALQRTATQGSVAQGGYLLSRAKKQAAITLLASGSEVSLALEAKKLLQAEGIATAVVSVPCFDLFVEQDESYLDSIIDTNSATIAIEAASAIEWFRLADTVIGMESFGASAPAGELAKEFGFTAEHIASVAKSVL